VELTGALSNPPFSLEGLGRLANRVRGRSKANGAWTRRDRPLPSRPGAVLTAVTSVLFHAGGPLSVSEVYAEVVSATGAAVPRSSVKMALSSHCRGAHARFRRVEFGVYEFAVSWAALGSKQAGG